MKVSTKGPWVAVGGGPLIVTMNEQEGKSVVARVMCKEDIGSVFKWKCSSVADLENVANANLIAASPELLDAAQSVLASLKVMTPDDTLDGCIMVLEIAIAKAEGGIKA